jgi:hypothetical protein
MEGGKKEQIKDNTNISGKKNQILSGASENCFGDHKKTTPLCF